MLERANSIYIPAGRWPTRGWILLARRDYNRLDPYGTSFQLDVGDPSGADNVGTLGGLSIVHAQCVTRGIAADPDAIYLVEITDARGILHNQWFQYPLVKQYNIRAPGYPQTFFPESLNDGTTWTWETMLEDIWGEMADVSSLGAWPGLPSVPAGVPEGFWFSGVSAWRALADVLDYLGMTVVCDLTEASPFTIVDSGGSDSAFDALQYLYGSHTSNKYRLEDDLEWLDVGAGRVPRRVVVLFRRRNAVYGSEETVALFNSDIAQQWSMKTVHEVSVDAPAAFLTASGTHHLWSDFTVRYDDSSNLLDEDLAAAAAIAQERATQYFNRIHDQTLGRMSQVYTGALPFTTGPRVDGVCYYQDYRDDAWAGWRTKIVRGFDPPFPEVDSRSDMSLLQRG